MATPARGRLSFPRYWTVFLFLSTALSTLSALYWTTKIHYHHQQQNDPIISQGGGTSSRLNTPLLRQHQQRIQRKRTQVGIMTAKNHPVDQQNVGNSSGSNNNNDQGNSPNDNSSIIRVAFIGNSILYYNDCPRLLEHMLQQSYTTVYQDSCLRGGSSFISLLRDGNGMDQKFKTPNARREDGSYDIGSPTIQSLLVDSPKNATPSFSSWDYIIMNDFTQAPAREVRRNNTIKKLQNAYLPMIPSTDETTVIFLQTAAYRKPGIKNSNDLGTFDNFTKLLGEGYAEYAKHIPNSKVAPVGLAYQYIRNHDEKTKNNNTQDGDDDDTNSLWYKLYFVDGFHPSPHGTLLEASVLYCTMTGKPAPTYDVTWWENARYMQPENFEPLPLPTVEEGLILQNVARIVCGLPLNRL